MRFFVFQEFNNMPILAKIASDIDIISIDIASLPVNSKCAPTNAKLFYTLDEQEYLDNILSYLEDIGFIIEDRHPYVEVHNKKTGITHTYYMDDRVILRFDQLK